MSFEVTFEGANRWWLLDTVWDGIPNCWSCIFDLRSYAGLTEEEEKEDFVSRQLRSVAMELTPFCGTLSQRGLLLIKPNYWVEIFFFFFLFFFSFLCDWQKQSWDRVKTTDEKPCPDTCLETRHVSRDSITGK